MTTTNVINNGRVRKNLATQLDRLDTILDGLADALNEAVASAVKEAVQTVLLEVLTNPEILSRMQGVSTGAQPAPAKTPNALTRLLQRVRNGIKVQIQACSQGCQKLWETVCLWALVVRVLFAMGLDKVRNFLWLTRPFQCPVLAALVAGVLAGVGAYLAGPWLAALTSSLAGFTTVLAVQTVLWIRRLFNVDLNVGA